MTPPNLFKTLSKYGSREAENYLTESFVLVIRTLLSQSATHGLELLNFLCGLNDAETFDNADLIQVSTQVTVDAGILDIEVRSGSDILVFVEIKHDAPLAPGQLEYYKARLDESRAATRVLVLLTRSLASSQETTLPSSEYHHVCWYDIHARLSSIKTDVLDEAAKFLIDQFLTFLEVKQMSLERVGWEYINGVPSMIALINMLEAAILETAPDIKLKRTAGASWSGFYVDNEYFCGIRFAEPLLIVFANNFGTSPTFEHPPLDLEQAHFFSLSQAEQLERLVAFIQQSITSKSEHEQSSGVEES